MAKRIYSNNMKDTWSNDSAEQICLVPMLYDQPINPFQLDEVWASLPADTQEEIEKGTVAYEETKDMLDASKAKDVGSRKYRNYMAKQSQVKETRKIAEGATDRHVSIHDFDDELFDDAVNQDNFKHESLLDYAAEVEKRKEPKVDTNGDGIIDKRDAETCSPLLSKFEKYM